MAGRLNSYLLLNFMKKIKVFEGFSGIGSQTQALKNAKIDHEVVAIAEIDKYAIASYEALHGPTLNLGDISRMDIEAIPDHDLFTYSFPCQDISVAGAQEGLDIDSGTRSGLLWECQKVIASKKPAYLLLENVKNLVGKRHKVNFDLWLEWLESQGYTNYWKVLNAKDYGIPQNRERVFVVSILGDHEEFIFPEEINLDSYVGDFLDDIVEEKFIIKDEKASNLLAISNNLNGIIQDKSMMGLDGNIRGYEKIMPAITAREYKEPRLVHISNLSTSKGRLKPFQDSLLRKITPLECWRLMGFSDDQFYYAQKTNSNTQLYKQAGNSIVVPVLEAIFNNMFACYSLR